MRQSRRQKLLCDLPAETLAYSKLLAYAAYNWPGYEIALHHALIAKKLEAVERGEIRRLMIFMPPRHGKSMLASEYFPAWYLGRNPENHIICATYAQDLADDFGRKVRNLISDPLYGEIFGGVTVRDDSSSARRFHTTRGGAYFAVGVGGPLTGRGANLLLVDDPVKNRADADSEVVRKKIKEWYTSTAYTRLMKDAAVIVIQTRWHEDDLSGWLLAEHAHEGWDVLELPAISDDAALWPEKFPISRLRTIQQSIGPRDWSALYQQRPAPEEGDYFKREWFRYYDTLPKHLRYYGASDYAVTEGGGDYTVHLVAGVDPEDNIYIVDLWRQQASSIVWVDIFIDLVRQYKPVQWGEENGQIAKGVGPLIDKRQREAGAYCYRQQYASAHDKPTRAQAIRGRMAQGKVYLPKDAPWRAEFEREMLTFPAGRHDDQVDALSLIGRMLDTILAAKRPPDRKPPTINTAMPTLKQITDEADRAWTRERDREGLS